MTKLLLRCRVQVPNGKVIKTFNRRGSTKRDDNGSITERVNRQRNAAGIRNLSEIIHTYLRFRSESKELTLYPSGQKKIKTMEKKPIIDRSIFRAITNSKIDGLL